jgi:hypothetical protein
MNNNLVKRHDVKPGQFFTHEGLNIYLAIKHTGKYKNECESFYAAMDDDTVVKHTHPYSEVYIVPYSEVLERVGSKPWWYKHIRLFSLNRKSVSSGLP